MQTKKSARNYLILIPILLSVFFAVNNFVWLTINQRPPIDDEAWHLRVAFLYAQELSCPSWGILEKLSRIDLMYPPLFSFVASLFALFFGKNILVLCMVNSLFTAGVFFCVYLIGRKLGCEEKGALAACLLSFYPMFFQLSRMGMLEMALTFMVTVTIVCFLYTEGFKNTRASIWAGILLGLGLLTKQVYIVFIIGPMLFILLPSFLRADHKRRNMIALNMLFLSTAGAIIAAPWYLSHFAAKWNLMKMAAFDQTVVPTAMRILSIHSLLYYFNELRDQVFPFFYYVFLIFLITKALKKFKNCGFFLIWIVIPYSILTIFPNKFFYYTVPYLPAVALISAYGILELREKLLRRIVLFVVLCMGIYQFFELSYLNYHVRCPILAGVNYSPYRGNYYTDELFNRCRQEGRGNKLILGIYGLEGNDIARKNLTIDENYVLTNPDWLGLYSYIKDVPYELVDLHYGKYLGMLRAEDVPYEFVDLHHGENSGMLPPVNFIISVNDLEALYLPYLKKDDFTLLDIFFMPDRSKVYLYKLRPGSNEFISPAKQEKERGVAEGNMRLILDQNAWKIFWKGKEITHSLSVYTSFRSNGRWCDSMHSFWETKKLGEKEILATEYSRDAPVIQIWRFRLEGNRIYWTVEMQANSMIKLEREQANIMLSGAYRTWSTSESAGYFPEGFNTDYGGDWQSLSTLEPRPDKRITALGDNVHLPTVSFYCTYPRNTMRGAIINSDDQFKGRVLQYVLKHGPLHFIAWCRYTYFQGYFLIEE